MALPATFRSVLYLDVFGWRDSQNTEQGKGGRGQQSSGDHGAEGGCADDDASEVSDGEDFGLVARARSGMELLLNAAQLEEECVGVPRREGAQQGDQHDQRDAISRSVPLQNLTPTRLLPPESCATGWIEAEERKQQARLRLAKRKSATKSKSKPKSKSKSGAADTDRKVRPSRTRRRRPQPHERRRRQKPQRQRSLTPMTAARDTSDSDRWTETRRQTVPSRKALSNFAVAGCTSRSSAR